MGAVAGASLEQHGVGRRFSLPAKRVRHSIDGDEEVCLLSVVGNRTMLVENIHNRCELVVGQSNPFHSPSVLRLQLMAILSRASRANGRISACTGTLASDLLTGLGLRVSCVSRRCVVAHTRVSRQLIMTDFLPSESARPSFGVRLCR